MVEWKPADAGVECEFLAQPNAASHGSVRPSSRGPSEEWVQQNLYRSPWLSRMCKRQRLSDILRVRLGRFAEVVDEAGLECHACRLASHSPALDSLVFHGTHDPSMLTEE